MQRLRQFPDAQAMLRYQRPMIGATPFSRVIAPEIEAWATMRGQLHRVCKYSSRVLLKISLEQSSVFAGLSKYYLHNASICKIKPEKD